jgi:hypothetical protein
MAEPEPLNASTPETAVSAGPPGAGGRSKDEVALDLMKFIAVATGYGKASQSSAGFSTKPLTRSAEEHADALLELFERCRRTLNKTD